MPAEFGLVAQTWTSAGPAGPFIGDEMSPLTIPQRVELLACDGWRGAGFRVADIERELESHSAAELRRVFETSGVRLAEVELMSGWWLSGVERERSDAANLRILELAAELGGAYVKAGGEFDVPPAPITAPVVDGLGELAERAGSLGIRIGLEPMPFTSIGSLADAVELTARVGHPAVGLAVDDWHLHRSGVRWDRLHEVLPIERVFSVELSDAATEVVGTLIEDTTRHRRWCGTGDLDVRGFVAVLMRMGYRGEWGVEIISDAHRALEPEAALARARETTLAELRAAERLVTGL